ncbi:Rve-domain-containing hypothetical protein [Phytophthora megakarya]|uniref:Integrase catalytic domain-containing protein n=1 Tax=Phytophthora megakarya TaxID=4795 RepID=A0A225WXQ3_9STRA|nr:Rve-domain-containing hypothetical protein [Phytophthora megakarya]
METKAQRTQTRISCDQGKEIVNKKLTNFLNEHQIELLTTNAYAPDEPSQVEKLNGGLMGKVRVINEAVLLPQWLWGEVIDFVSEVDNMSTPQALDGMTPYETLFANKPQVKDPHPIPASFWGYAKASLGYRILYLETRKAF